MEITTISSKEFVEGYTKPKAIATKENATYNDIIEALKGAKDGDMVYLDYHTVINSELDSSIEKVCKDIRSMSVEELNTYELNNKITDFYFDNIKGENKKVTYFVHKDAKNELEFTSASYLLFKDVDGNYKSVYIRNINSIIVSGIEFVR